MNVYKPRYPDVFDSNAYLILPMNELTCICAGGNYLIANTEFHP